MPCTPLRPSATFSAGVQRHDRRRRHGHQQLVDAVRGPDTLADGAEHRLDPGQAAAQRHQRVQRRAATAARTCLDGSPNTIGVPADSPHATAVGGTTPGRPGFTLRERDRRGGGSADSAGRPGRLRREPVLRAALVPGRPPARADASVPDVVRRRRPGRRHEICQADAGGCPNGLLHGGTSLAAPAWAACRPTSTALGTNLGEANRRSTRSPTPARSTRRPSSAATSRTSGSARRTSTTSAILALLHQTIGPVELRRLPSSRAAVMSRRGRRRDNRPRPGQSRRRERLTGERQDRHADAERREVTRCSRR